MTSSAADVLTVIDAGILPDYDAERYPLGAPYLAADFTDQPNVHELAKLEHIDRADVRRLAWCSGRPGALAFHMELLKPSVNILLSADLASWSDVIENINWLG